MERQCRVSPLNTVKRMKRRTKVLAVSAVLPALCIGIVLYSVLSPKPMCEDYARHLDAVTQIEILSVFGKERDMLSDAERDAVLALLQEADLSYEALDLYRRQNYYGYTSLSCELTLCFSDGSTATVYFTNPLLVIVRDVPARYFLPDADLIDRIHRLYFTMYKAHFPVPEHLEYLFAKYAA